MDFTVHKRWPSEFPKLAELQEEAANREKHGFFDGIPNGIRTSLGYEAYSELEKELATLDPEAWKYLKEEVLQCNMAPDPVRGYSSVIGRLNEAKGYVYLNEGYTDIKFIPRSTSARVETPDLRAHSETLGSALLEVKTIYQSDDETKYVIENMRRIVEGEEPMCRRASSDLPKGLLDKLLNTLEKATSQLLFFEPESKVRRIAYFIIHLDFGPAMADSSYHAIPKFLQDQEKRIEIVCDFRGL